MILIESIVPSYHTVLVRTIGIHLLLVFSLWAQPTISLENATQEALENSLSIKAAQKRVLYHKFSSEEIGLWANPEIELGTENLGLAEVELMVSQTIPLGSSRSIAIAQQDVAIKFAQAELNELELSVQAQVYNLFYSLLAMQQHSVLLDSTGQTAQSDLNRIRLRVAKGAAMSLDTLRAKTVLLSIDQDRRNYLHAYQNRETELLVTMGRKQTERVTLLGEYGTDLPDISLKEVLPSLQSHPSLMKASYALKEAELEYQVIDAASFSEIALSGGIKRNNEDGAFSGVLAVAVEIPLFNSNASSLKASHESIVAQKLEQENTQKNKTLEVTVLVNDLMNTKQNIEVLKNDILPNYRATWLELQRLYESGNISISEVLDSRNEYLEQHKALIDLTMTWFDMSFELFEKTGFSGHMATIKKLKIEKRHVK